MNWILWHSIKLLLLLFGIRDIEIDKKQIQCLMLNELTLQIQPSLKIIDIPLESIT